MAARMSKVFKAKVKEFENVSEGYDRRWLAQDHVLARFGLPGDIVAVSYDQVQSLLAIATTKSIHVLGQNGVEIVYQVAAGREVAHLQLHRSHLIAIDTKHVLYTWLLEDKTRDPVITQPIRGVVTATHVEASVDWLFLGMKDGTVCVWDIEGEQIAPSFKIKNQYFERQEDWRLMGEVYAVPRYHISPVVQLCLHPLDLGMLLVVYADGACLYSIKDGTTKTFYECIFPNSIEPSVQKPALTCATFSPDGRFVVIGCNDGSLAFFDISDGEVPLQVRSLEQADINLLKNTASDKLRYNPITSIRWCCRVEPNDTFLLIAGGLPADIDGLTVLDYGTAPSRAQDLPEYFGSPQRHKILPISRAQVLDLLPLGTASPYHMSHDPRCVLILAANGNVTTLEVPDGRPVSINALPPSLTLCSPPMSQYTLGKLPHHIATHLNNQTKKEAREKSLLTGGAVRESRQQGERPGSVLCTVHEGTLLRIYDIAQDLIMMPPIAEIDTTLTMPNTFVTKVAFSDNTGEIAVASETGMVVIHRTSSSTIMETQLQQAFMDLSLVEPMPTPIADAKDMLFKFTQTRSASATFDPLCVISARRGQVTALDVSAVGFVAIAYDSGFLMLIDLRGPAIFYAGYCETFEIKKRDRMFKKPTTPKLSSSIVEYATTVSFLAMNVESRISLVAVLGTNQGRVISFELLKDPNGIYTAILHNIFGVSTLSPIQSICACNQFGEDLAASGVRLGSINMDAEVPECLIVTAREEVVSYSDLSTKIASSSFRGSGADGTARLVTLSDTEITVLAVTQQSGTIELFSIPELKALGSTSLHRHSANQVTILEDGRVMVYDDAHSLTLFDLFGKGQKMDSRLRNDLYDALKQPSIPRPTISNWAWVTGTQYIKPKDLDQLITGGTRPMSKRALERLAASEKQQALLERQAASRDKASNRAVLQSARQAGGNDRVTGRNAYGEMQQHGQERGERISQVNDVFDNISKASGEWLSEIDKMTSSAKKSAGKAAFKRFLGF